MIRCQVPPSEQGFALPLALFALVIIGALIAGTFFLGRLEQQAGRATLYLAQAAAAAEAGLVAAESYDPAVLLTLPVQAGAGGPVAAFPTIPVGADPTVRYTDTIARLTSTLFLIQATGQRLDADGHPLATHTLGAFAREIKRADGTSVIRSLRQRSWIQLY